MFLQFVLRVYERRLVLRVLIGSFMDMEYSLLPAICDFELVRCPTHYFDECTSTAHSFIPSTILIPLLALRIMFN